MSGSTCAGSFERSASSLVTIATCSYVGISPVSSSHSRPSGSGSSAALPEKVGSFSCSSGIV